MMIAMEMEVDRPRDVHKAWVWYLAACKTATLEHKHTATTFYTTYKWQSVIDLYNRLTRVIYIFLEDKIGESKICHVFPPLKVHTQSNL